MCGEIFSFLGIEETPESIEFSLGQFGSDEINAFAFNTLNLEKGSDELSTSAEALETETVTEVIESNAGEMTTDEVIDSVQNQVAQDEANDPIFATEPVAEPVATSVDDWS